MQMKFKTKTGYELTGTVIGKGFIEVDDTCERLNIYVEKFPHLNFWIPENECEAA